MREIIIICVFLWLICDIGEVGDGEYWSWIIGLGGGVYCRVEDRREECDFIFRRGEWLLSFYFGLVENIMLGLDGVENLSYKKSWVVGL